MEILKTTVSGIRRELNKLIFLVDKPDNSKEVKTVLRRLILRLAQITK